MQHNHKDTFLLHLDKSLPPLPSDSPRSQSELSRVPLSSEATLLATPPRVETPSTWSKNLKRLTSAAWSSGDGDMMKTSKRQHVREDASKHSSKNILWSMKGRNDTINLQNDDHTSVVQLESLSNDGWPRPVKFYPQGSLVELPPKNNERFFSMFNYSKRSRTQKSHPTKRSTRPEKVIRPLRPRRPPNHLCPSPPYNRYNIGSDRAPQKIGSVMVSQTTHPGNDNTGDVSELFSGNISDFTYHSNYQIRSDMAEIGGLGIRFSDSGSRERNSMSNEPRASSPQSGLLHLHSQQTQHIQRAEVNAAASASKYPETFLATSLSGLALHRAASRRLSRPESMSSLYSLSPNHGQKHAVTPALTHAKSLSSDPAYDQQFEDGRQHVRDLGMKLREIYLQDYDYQQSQGSLRTHSTSNAPQRRQPPKATNAIFTYADTATQTAKNRDIFDSNSTGQHLLFGGNESASDSIDTTPELEYDLMPAPLRTGDNHHNINVKHHNPLSVQPHLPNTQTHSQPRIPSTRSSSISKEPVYPFPFTFTYSSTDQSPSTSLTSRWTTPSLDLPSTPPTDPDPYFSMTHVPSALRPSPELVSPRKAMPQEMQGRTCVAHSVDEFDFSSIYDGYADDTPAVSRPCSPPQQQMPTYPQRGPRQLQTWI